MTGTPESTSLTSLQKGLLLVSAIALAVSLFLVRNGASVNAATEHGYTPLHIGSSATMTHKSHHDRHTNHTMIGTQITS